MSGGSITRPDFDGVIEDIRHAITSNGKPDRDGYAYTYSKRTMAEFKRALYYLRIAKVYATRIDYLLANDDSEETFHVRLAEDFEKARKEK